MRVIAVELGTLMLVDRILDGERMQFELLGDRLQIFLGRSAVVKPHAGALVSKMLGDVLGREVLERQLAVAIEPGVSHQRTIGPAPDRAPRRAPPSALRSSATALPPPRRIHSLTRR